MSAQPNPDRPLLRIFQPPPPGPPGADGSSSGEPEWTIRSAFDEYVRPELTQAAVSTRRDCDRFLRYWEEFESALPTLVPPQDTRTTNDPRIGYPWVAFGGGPLPLKVINTRLVTAYRDWITSPDGLNLGASTANKAFKLLSRIMSAAGEDGIAVNSLRTKSLPTRAAPKYYIDDLEIALLWCAADSQIWPNKEARGTFEGSGMSPATFWRAVIIFLRTYGMRVQDLVAYERRKQPVTWGSITLQPRTPDPEGRSESPLGWLYYEATKTGRQYYLPLTPPARAAVDRLRRAAADHCGCEPDALPSDRPILPCPSGHGLGNHWRALQKRAGVSNKAGQPYVLEDFRKTAATFLAEHHPELPYLVCGWSTAKSAVAAKHYINAERTLVAHLPSAPMPGCFRDWLEVI